MTSNNLLKPFAQSVCLLLSILLVALPNVNAQQKTSKSKSSNKIYEKPGGLKDILIKNTLQINSTYLEFSPTFYQNGIVFVSSRKKHGPVDKKIGQTYFELFYSEKDSEGTPMKPQAFSVNLNSQLHEGPVSFSSDGQTMFLTRNNLEKGMAKTDSKGTVRMKIYESQKGQFDWENIQELPFNSDEYSCIHPSLSIDNKRLYFSSDMPGGQGGYDLYFAEKVGDTWTEPINMGPTINTSRNEVFPFIHQSGTLFFSSDGQENNYGGLDVFMIDISGRSWGNVTNLGLPFNSREDDLGFILEKDGEAGFLASNRKGGYGEDDIYHFEILGGFNDVNANPSTPARVVVYDPSTGANIPNAAVRIFERASDGFIEGDNLYDIEFTDGTGSNEELVMKLIRKNTEDLGEPIMNTNTEGEAIFQLDKNKNYILLVTKDGYESGEQLYSTYNIDTPETLRIPLNSLTCSMLTGRVTEGTYKAAVANARLTIMDKATGRSERTNIDNEGAFEYCLQTGKDYVITLEKRGYETMTTPMSTKGRRAGERIDFNVQMVKVAAEIVKEPLREGTVIVLENIYYDFNKSAIRSGAARELDALVQLMKAYPSMEVELYSHTDSRGDNDYNEKLSLERAISAKSYLEGRGIQAKRIKAFGLGESQIRNQCINGAECDDAAHEFNRRTEVKISKLNADVDIRYKE